MQFRCSLWFLLTSFFFLYISSVVPATAAVRPERDRAFSKYVEIPGASHVGSDACAACHIDTAKNFRHAFHQQQGLECEDCHGNGSLHVDGGGDTSKIIGFWKRPAQTANGICLGCHARQRSVRYWMSGSHSANHVRCVDCHQVHATGLAAGSEYRSGFDTATQGALAAASVSPETNVILRPRSATNDACLKCHESERAQLSMPYRHPLREGKMSCADCHDPHGGRAGNNLRTANINELCLGCHAQYRGPFSYQHPPVSENCMNCHQAHGSPNTNLLNVSEPALCLQCHTGHHNGAGLPLPDRCTNCHGSIHGTDVATPSGGSRFVDKGPYGVPGQPPQPVGGSTRAAVPASAVRLLPSHFPTYAAAAGGGALAAFGSARALAPLSGGSAEAADGDSQTAETLGAADSAFSLTPGQYRFVNGTGFLGRVGEYDSLQQSAGANAVTASVLPQYHMTVISQADVTTGDDYSAKSQVTAGERLQAGFDVRSFVQQQDDYPFYAGVMSPDLAPITDLVPSHVSFGVTRRLGDANARLKLPKVPVHLFVTGNWQARSGVTQFHYLDENTTPNCGELCHYTSRFQPLNYTTRNLGGGADVDFGPVRLTMQHHVSSFNDRLTFPTARVGPFTPADEPPPSPVPVPPAVVPGNYFLDIPSPNRAATDSLNMTWTASARLNFNGHVSYSRLRNTLTSHQQNLFDTDETLNWRPSNRLRLTTDYHQHNLINDFTPFYALFGNVSYHDHSEGAKLDYELARSFDAEAYYRRGGITRSNAALWPQAYSFDNTDLLTVVPSSWSNTTGIALRYHDRGYWSTRAGYEWTGTHDPGYLIVPGSNNRTFADLSFLPAHWLTVANELSIIAQNAFPSIPLPNNPGSVFQRRNRFFSETASATLSVVSAWNLGLGYSYAQQNLATYMAFQNDNSVGYVVDGPAVPYKQITQAYWGESTYTVRNRLGLNLRLTFNSSRSGMRPDVNPNDAALLGNGALIASGTCESGASPCFDAGMFQQALGNVVMGATQVSEVIVPQWIGQSKVYYRLPAKFEGGLVFYYGSYRDQFNPGLNGVLRTFNVYAGRSW